MTVKQAAERLEVSQSTVYALIAAGRLRCNRYGIRRGAIRISEEQLAAYLAESQQDATPEKQPPVKGGAFRFLDREKLKRAWQQD